MPVTDQDLEHRRAALLEREMELSHALEQGREAAQPVELDQSSVGRLSRMDAMQSQALSAEAQRRREADLTRVRSALGRLADGTYGDCLVCGEPIGDRRLEHDPAATTCIDCARQRRSGSG
jgi:DnaK suppressor protein